MRQAELGEAMVDGLDQGLGAGAVAGFGPLGGTGVGGGSRVVEDFEQSLVVGVLTGRDPALGVSRRTVGGGLLRWTDE
ncbi:hypothetical protein [Streptomyces malaysiensis]|uniref:Uncharacterized protein n=1 Tax=Streptomyces malaysiensis TaxID=92644 RepID=A0A7X5X2S7_STRMQ|nr:hypothetical protein [Streptomyces malaysiensis]NIY65595.1 hypothetical protein [Streptomyces malaysiensis]